MTTRPQAVDVWRRAGWLPEDQDDLESWLDGHRERVEAQASQGKIAFIVASATRRQVAWANDDQSIAPAEERADPDHVAAAGRLSSGSTTTVTPC